jgi:hypothetical protein
MNRSLIRENNVMLSVVVLVQYSHMKGCDVERNLWKKRCAKVFISPQMRMHSESKPIISAGVVVHTSTVEAGGFHISGSHYHNLDKVDILTFA